MIETDKAVFFWGGWPSQWYTSPFKYQDREFIRCEQFMMFKKAELFQDETIAQKILETNNAKRQKQYGRDVKNFDEKIWLDNARDIVRLGNWCKFNQNEPIKRALLGTKSKMIVEASPDDRLWGIGLAEDNPAVHDPKNWLGKNWLGEVLMQVRTDLITGHMDSKPSWRLGA